jgi:hypothetical protein
MAERATQGFGNPEWGVEVCSEEEEPLDGREEPCLQNLELRWQRELESSIYATPVIADLFADGMKEVVVNSFVHYVEMLEGDTGACGPPTPSPTCLELHKGSGFARRAGGRQGVVALAMPTHRLHSCGGRVGGVQGSGPWAGRSLSATRCTRRRSCATSTTTDYWM